MIHPVGWIAVALASATALWQRTRRRPWARERRRLARAGRRGRPQRCSRCEVIFAAGLKPDAKWFVLCSRCLVVARERALALLLLFVLVGAIVLFLQV